MLHTIFHGVAKSGARIDFAFMLADRGLRLPIGLITAALIARHLGAEAFGWLNYAIAIMTVGTAVAQLGLDIIVVKSAAQNPQQAETVLSAAFVLRLVTGGVLAVGLWVWTMLSESGIPQERMVVGVLALGFLTPAMGVPALWFQAQTKSRIAVTIGFFVFMFMTALRCWFVWRGATVTVFAWLIIVELFGNSVLMWAAMKRAGGGVRFASTSLAVRPLLREGWPLLVGGLAGSLFMRLDLMMLRWLEGADRAGMFAAATRLSEAAYSIPALLATSVMATLSVAGSKPEEFGERVDRYFQASAAIGYLLTLPVVFGAPWIIPLLFGDEYSEAVRVAQIHIVSVFFICLTLARGRVLVVQGMVKFTMVSSLAGCVCSLILNAVLIPTHGAIGAAVATVISHALAGVGMTLAYKPARPVGWRLIHAMARPRLGFGR